MSRRDDRSPARNDRTLRERTLRERLLPNPWITLWLWLGWLLLNQTVEPGHVLLGLALALFIGRLSSRGQHALVAGPREAEAGTYPRRGGLHRTLVAVRLFLVVFWDIIVANVQVAMLILGPQERLRPAFFKVPLDVTRPRSITLLAGIITMTPGTLSSELSDDHTYLLVHGLDVGDEAGTIAQIKARYEAPILEMFE
jgi:multicomponent K+:H+ antiporter subunit E